MFPRERQSVLSVRNAAGAALLLALAVAPGCSDLALPMEEAAASPADPRYGELVARHLKTAFKDRAAYDAFEISGLRWVHSLKGWTWLACVRFQDRGHQRAYALFIKDGTVIDGRYAVQTDACDSQTYAPFEAMMPANAGFQEPLY